MGRAGFHSQHRFHQAWRCTSVTPAQATWRREDHQVQNHLWLDSVFETLSQKRKKKAAQYDASEHCGGEGSRGGFGFWPGRTPSPPEHTGPRSPPGPRYPRTPLTLPGSLGTASGISPLPRRAPPGAGFRRRARRPLRGPWQRRVDPLPRKDHRGGEAAATEGPAAGSTRSPFRAAASRAPPAGPALSPRPIAERELSYFAPNLSNQYRFRTEPRPPHARFAPKADSMKLLPMRNVVAPTLGLFWLSEPRGGGFFTFPSLPSSLFLSSFLLFFLSFCLSPPSLYPFPPRVYVD